MEILKFYSKTCGPCKVLERNLKQTDIVYKDIDVASEEGLALLDKYNIISVPTLVKIDGDKIDIRVYSNSLDTMMMKRTGFGSRI